MGDVGVHIVVHFAECSDGSHPAVEISFGFCSTGPADCRPEVLETVVKRATERLAAALLGEAGTRAQQAALSLT